MRIINYRILVLLTLLLNYLKKVSTNELKVIRQWTQLDFRYPDEKTRREAILKGDHISGKSLPVDVDAYYGSGDKPRIFITIPRFDVGRPITLGTVDERGRIYAYPDYSWNANQGHNCNGLTSVFRVALDKCDRLWVMDTGKIGDHQMCPPQLLAFNLKTDRLVYRHKFDPSSYLPISLFITPVVDVKENPKSCADTFVYIADVTGFGIMVVNVSSRYTWWITQRYLYPNPFQGKITIEGTTFDNMDGVFGMALTPFKEGQDRTLYFHALASLSENFVRTSILKNASMISTGSRMSSLSDYASSIKRLSGRRWNPAAAEAIDSNSILYFSQTSPPSIFCWNTKKLFHPRNFYPIAVNSTTLQFGSGLKIVNGRNGQELWVLTDRFQKYITETLTDDTVNFRILVGHIATLLKNSPCLI